MWRHDDGEVQVLLVHRPRYDDWSLPKGKLRRREHPIIAACREVREETGLHASVGARLPTAYYMTRSGTTRSGTTRSGTTRSGTNRAGADEVGKVVEYWAMTVVADGGFTPGAEIDELAWLTVDRALARLSYEHDVPVLNGFAELSPLSPPVLLLRHASAGERDEWSGPDAERPLDRAGLARAEEMAPILRCFDPVRLVSGPPLRCTQTLAPLAAATGLAIEVDAVFDESADALAAAGRLRDLGGRTGRAVVCSQGRLIPPVLAALTGADPEPYRTRKGTGWVLSFLGDDLAALDELA